MPMNGRHIIGINFFNMTGDKNKKPFKEFSDHHKAEMGEGHGFWLHGFGNAKPIYDHGETVRRVIRRSNTKKDTN